MGVGPLGVKWGWCQHAVRAAVKNTSCRFRGSKFRWIDSSTMGKWLGEGAGDSAGQLKGRKNICQKKKKNSVEIKVEMKGWCEQPEDRMEPFWMESPCKPGASWPPSFYPYPFTRCCLSHAVLHAATHTEARHYPLKHRSGPGKFWQNALIPFREVRSGRRH